MITGNVNLRSNIVATTIGSAAVTRGGGGSLPLIENKTLKLLAWKFQAIKTGALTY